MRSINFRGFTLVELIVVITIVGILSTVGFVSYSGYLTGARDSNRMSQMVKLSDSLQVYSSTRTLPLPDDYVEVRASGSIIAYQGDVGVDVLETIDYTNGGLDPKDDSYYTYYLTKDRKSLQLMALMEEQQSVAQINPLNISETYAIDYDDRFVKVYGRKLGVLTTNTTPYINNPLNSVASFQSQGYVDVVTEASELIAHVSDDEKIEGTGTAIQAIIPNGSCNRIKQVGNASGNGVYRVNPGGSGEISVYCDMETSGGGWTMIARSYPSSPIAFGTPTGSVSIDTASYVLGPITDFSYSEAMMASYDSGKLITGSSKAAVTPPLTSFTEGTHTLATAGISGGTLTGHGMFFIK